MLSDPELAATSEVRAAAAPNGVSRLRLFGRCVLAYAIVTSIVPFSPLMPGTGRDPSWMLAINRAASQGLQFGRDVVFTYGPYGGVMTHVYEPGIRTLMLAAALLFAAGYVAAALVALRQRSASTLLLAGFVVLVLAAYSLDALVLIYPLVVVFAIEHLPVRAGSRIDFLVLVIAPFGILPLVKLSVLPAVLSGLAAVAVVLWHRVGATTLAALMLLPWLSLVGWWLAAGQSLVALLDYFRTSWQIVVGYSEAMSLHETSRVTGGVVTGTFVVLCLLIVFFSVLGSGRSRDDLATSAMVSVTLFLVFKAAFVRADAHMEMSVLAVLAAWTLVSGRSRTPKRFGRRVVGVAVGVGAFLSYLATAPVLPIILAVDVHTVDLASEVLHGDTSPAALRHRYAESMKAIRDRTSAGEWVVGPTDSYGFSLSLLFAHGAVWDPRPVIQSYSAYTPQLARLNARHLTGDGAPETVLFRVDPIDRRLPALEDGSSWLPLLENYDVGAHSARYLVLHRRAAPRPFEVGTGSTRTGHLGAEVTIPPSTFGWLATFDVRPTFVGKLRNVLWKQPQLRIDLRLTDGSTVVKRFVPSMAHTAFLLSPYVADTRAFRSLFPDQPAAQPARTVTSFRIRLEDPGYPGSSQSWQSTYRVLLRPVGPDAPR